VPRASLVVTMVTPLGNAAASSRNVARSTGTHRILDGARVTRFRSARVVVAIGSSRSLASSPRCAFSRRAHRDGRAAA
jgi:hypothetical protein